MWINSCHDSYDIMAKYNNNFNVRQLMINMFDIILSPIVCSMKFYNEYRLIHYNDETYMRYSCIETKKKIYYGITRFYNFRSIYITYYVIFITLKFSYVTYIQTGQLLLKTICILAKPFAHSKKIF